jgi:hypothetical protein
MTIARASHTPHAHTHAHTGRGPGRAHIAAVWLCACRACAVCRVAVCRVPCAVCPVPCAVLALCWYSWFSVRLFYCLCFLRHHRLSLTWEKMNRRSGGNKARARSKVVQYHYLAHDRRPIRPCPPVRKGPVATVTSVDRNMGAFACVKLETFSISIRARRGTKKEP